MKYVISALWLVSLPMISAAHHSRAEFVGEIEELEGEIVDLYWANPHPHVAINVVAPDGSQQIWRVEMWTNLFGTEAAGVTSDLFNEGDSLRVAGQFSRRRDGYMLGNNLLFTDNVEAVLNPNAGQRWTEQLLGRVRSEAEDRAHLAAAAQQNRGIFRVWTPAATRGEPGIGIQIANFAYTEEALAGQAAWDELDNFLTRCEQPGMPWTMVTPQNYEFVDDGETIRLRAQYFDTTRIIHVEDAANPRDQQASHLGYSVGRWEGETLVVETTRINWPFFDFRGTPQSEAVQITERYSLSADQSRLSVEITVTDPLPFSEPASFEFDWLALGETIGEYNCQVY